MKSNSPFSTGSKPRRLSQILNVIAADETRDAMTIGDLLHRLQGRAYGAMLLLFATPNMVPTPPGFSAILGLPLFYLSVQLMLDMRAPKLPHFITKRSIDMKVMRKVILKLNPWIMKIESWLKPRYRFFTGRLARRFIGAVILALSVMIILPIPFGNMPPAATIVLFALALVERDGLAILLGLVMAVISALIVSSVVGAAFLTITMFWEKWIAF